MIGCFLQYVAVLIISGAVKDNMGSGLQCLVVAWAGCGVWGKGKKCLSELSCVGMTCSALENPSKYLSFVL